MREAADSFVMFGLTRTAWRFPRLGMARTLLTPEMLDHQ